MTTTTTQTEPTEPDETTTPDLRRRLALSERLPRYVAEMLIGLLLAALIALALIASVGSVPFIYQGY